MTTAEQDNVVTSTGTGVRGIPAVGRPDYELGAGHGD